MRLLIGIKVKAKEKRQEEEQKYYLEYARRRINEIQLSPIRTVNV